VPFWLPIPTNVGSISAGEKFRITWKTNDIENFPAFDKPQYVAVPGHSDMKLLVHSIVKDVPNKRAFITFELVNV